MEANWREESEKIMSLARLFCVYYDNIDTSLFPPGMDEHFAIKWGQIYSWLCDYLKPFLQDTRRDVSRRVSNCILRMWLDSGRMHMYNASRLR